VAVTGAQIAARGLFYVGSPYTYGGAMGTVPDKDEGGDCSGYYTGVMCRDLGLAGPGIKPGTFTGASHGPVVIQWATWNGAVTLPKGQLPQPGDMCVWPGLGPLGHIGIAVSATEMVSALNPHYGVVRTPIAGNGPAGVQVVYRRITGVVMAGGTAAGAAAAGQTTGAAGAAGGAVLVLGAALVPVVLAGALLVGALLAGLLGGALILAVIRGGRQ
jgi:hypothetical protein